MNRLAVMFLSTFALFIPVGCATYHPPLHDQPTVRSSRDPQLVSAIIEVESGGDPRAVSGDSVGILQIRPIMVDDVNRILGRRRYTLADRRDPRASIDMFWIYADHYSPGASRETIARRWNGGPTGDRKPHTADYWRKVLSHLR